MTAPAPPGAYFFMEELAEAGVEVLSDFTAFLALFL